MKVQQREKVDRWQASRILIGQEHSRNVNSEREYDRYVNVAVENESKPMR